MAVTFVGDEPDAAPRGDMENALELLGVQHRAARVRWGVHKDRLRLRRQMPLDLRCGEREALLLIGLHKDTGAAGIIHHVFIGHPVGHRNYHLIAGIHQHLHEVEDDVLSTYCNDALGWRVRCAEIRGMPVADGFFQLDDAADSGVLGEVFVQGAHGRLFDVIGSRKVRFTGAEIDHVDALAAQTVRLGGHAHGGRNADGAHPFGQRVSSSGTHLMADSPKIRFRSRCSTLGGTSPEISPPSRNTSFTRRALIKEYASPAMRNTVSISGWRRRFINAICNSYS